MAYTKGVFYMTGVGPGDPELITKKAIRILEHCPVIAAPQKGARSLALSIAQDAVDLSGKEILPLTFPMTEDPEILARNYRDAADQIRTFLDQGRDVAMVILGDVSIYSTGTYIYRLLKNEGYEAVMVPGVPSFCAVAAALGTSLTEGSRPMHVIPAGRTDLDSALELDGTKILMKSGTHIYDTIEKIKEHGMLENAAMVTDCGLATQKVYEDLSRVSGEIGYFATICVKDGDGRKR